MTSQRSSTVSSTADALNDRTFEQYKLAVEMADRVSARRASANNFFLAVNAGMATLVGLLYPVPAGSAPSTSTSDTGFLLAAIAGLALASAWWLTLRSYRDLSRAKWDVINGLEEKFPAAVFSQEWTSLKGDPIQGWRGRYAELGQVERLVPAVFGALYGIAFLAFLCS